MRDFMMNEIKIDELHTTRLYRNLLSGHYYWISLVAEKEVSRMDFNPEGIQNDYDALEIYLERVNALVYNLGMNERKRERALCRA